MRQDNNFDFGTNSNYQEGLKYELGLDGSIDHKKALLAYQKGEKEHHYLSHIKVLRSKLRLMVVLPVIFISIMGFVFGLITNQFWFSSFTLFATGFSWYLVDWQRYWYKIGFAFKAQRVSFYLSLIIFLPLSALLPFFYGLSFFPLIALFVVGFFLTGVGILLLFVNNDKFNWFVAIYGMGLFLISIFSYSIPTEDIKFSYVEIDGGIEITKYRSSESVVNIPVTLNNLPVVSIRSYAFYNMDITEVYIGSHVQYVGNYAFANNNQLKKVWIEDGVQLSIGLFANNHALKEVRLPNDLVTLPSYTFYENKSIEKIELPNSIKSIGDFALNGLDALTSIEIPNQVEVIGNYALANLPKITSVAFPPLINYLGKGVLANSDNLISVSMPPNLDYIPDFFAFGLKSMTSFDLPNHVTSIGESAFENTIKLSDFYFHDDISYIGPRAFTNTSLKTITLPSKLSNLSDYAFANNALLEEVILSEGLQKIGIGTFQNNIKLENILFPSSLIGIGPNAFQYVPLREIILPENLTHLGDYAFANNHLIEAITFPSAITKIPRGILANTTALKTITFQGQITDIGHSAFNQTVSLNQVVFPSSLISVEAFAFFGSESLETLVFPEGLKRIEAYAFYGLNNLNTLVLPSTLERIEDGAFAMASALGDVWISNKVKFIGHYAFFGCVNLTISYEGPSIPSTWITSWNDLSTGKIEVLFLQGQP
jgi:hypothetical protein